ncbi:DUF397 domain-containing protein [Actinomadura rugatobispora]|uniref:DUF397 domain-containing protein n=1 Tax=Actinomadura rugatobispora TaxID=1994 RepID=A0ABW1A9Q5_9ACTN|nr:hypothetical protein GCM10010200_067150 [Actinomadura rugatobispora]
MTIWRKSSHSGGAGGTDECVELARLTDAIGVRDSKNATGPILHLDHQTFATLLHTIKSAPRSS